MAEVTIKIDGMSCQHCVTAVKKAVDAVDGVSSSNVEVGSAVVSFDESKTNSDAITGAIQAAGYKVVS
ncbi:MAG: heavy-metal-associated domain-containing protein [Nitrospiraceae bacterium]|nr:MAG: heavy-metal-associated domain-containing protein [Nitrospiraceae bacterium]